MTNASAHATCSANIESTNNVGDAGVDVDVDVLVVVGATSVVGRRRPSSACDACARRDQCDNYRNTRACSHSAPESVLSISALRTSTHAHTHTRARARTMQLTSAQCKVQREHVLDQRQRATAQTQLPRAVSVQYNTLRTHLPQHSEKSVTHGREQIETRRAMPVIEHEAHLRGVRVSACIPRLQRSHTHTHTSMSSVSVSGSARTPTRRAALALSLSVDAGADVVLGAGGVVVSSLFADVDVRASVSALGGGKSIDSPAEGEITRTYAYAHTHTHTHSTRMYRSSWSTARSALRRRRLAPQLPLRVVACRIASTRTRCVTQHNATSERT
jgi:hypothetical protein